MVSLILSLLTLGIWLGLWLGQDCLIISPRKRENGENAKGNEKSADRHPGRAGSARAFPSVSRFRSLRVFAAKCRASFRHWLDHAGFWRIDAERAPPGPASWPAVTAVIPARNEAALIGTTLRSLAGQDYPGRLRIIVVDDHSEDGTTAAALRTAREIGRIHRLGDRASSTKDTKEHEEEPARAGFPFRSCPFVSFVDEARKRNVQVVAAGPLPAGWTGKVWAMQEGLTHALSLAEPAPYVLFSDADIEHGEGALRELVARAEAGPCDLVSFMVRLHCRSAAEKLMIPAFVFFFRLLYPFRRINDPADPLAGAAGGTMLLRREALARIGGLAAIRGELIDDCALARAVKRGGHRIWMGLSRTSSSTRSYGSLAEIVGMIARTAYTQLGYSPLRLLGCVAGLALTFLAPPLLLLLATGVARVLGGLAWLLMTLLFLPMVRFYGLSPLWAPLLPVTTLVFLRATLLSAWQHHRGQGGGWKGRSEGR